MGLYPGAMHRAWAKPRAWKKRLQGALLGLLCLLPLALFVHPAWGLVSLLALLYPTRREEEAALAELDRRYGLAYRSALEAPAGHPWRGQLEAEASASLSRARPPAFPWPLAVAYLALIGLIWVLPPLQNPLNPPASVGQTSSPSPQASPGSPEQAPNRPPERNPLPNLPQGQRTEQTEPESQAPVSSPPDPQTQSPTEQKPSAPNPQNQPSAGEPKTVSEPGQPDQPGQAQPSQPGQAQPTPNQPGQQKGDAQNAERPTQPQKGSQGQQGPGPGQKQIPQNGQQSQSADQSPRTQGQSGPQPGPSSSPKDERGSGPASQQPLPQAPNPQPGIRPNGEAPIQRGSSQGRPQPLPSPWPSGQPPQNVQRQAENYLQSEPLPPEVREVLRQYFELSADSP